MSVKYTCLRLAGWPPGLASSVPESCARVLESPRGIRAGKARLRGAHAGVPSTRAGRRQSEGEETQQKQPAENGGPGLRNDVQICVADAPEKLKAKGDVRYS